MPDGQKMKVKIALVGDNAVGKTSLIRRFVKDEFSDKYISTLGAKVTKIELVVPHEDIEVQVVMVIFDIMGQAGFRDLIKETFFEGCQGLLAVCDVTRKSTLAAIHDWMSAATQVAGDVPARLLVNKIDLAGQRRDFPDSEVERVAATWEVPWAHASAKTGEGVDDAFSGLAVEIVEDAFRSQAAHAVEVDLRRKVLLLVAKRGRLGVSRAEFFAALRGVPYEELERELEGLERQALLTIHWRDAADFTAEITPLGLKATEGA